MRKNEKTAWQTCAAILLFSGLVLTLSCEKHRYQVETINPADSVYFQADLQPIFTAKCILCHKGTRNPDLRTGNSYTSLSAGSFITPPDSTCTFYAKINSGHPSSLTDIERQKILLWIKQGAHNN